MRYQGSKGYSKRDRLDLGREIVKIMTTLTPADLLFDVCCGALNVSRHFKGERIGIDACAPLITTLNAAISGWDPPESVSKDTWLHYKNNPDPNDPLTGFLMFGRSWNGRAWSKYLPDVSEMKPKKRKPWIEQTGKIAKQALVSRASDCKGMSLFCVPYWDLISIVPGCIVYCDPPYEGTAGYPHVGLFDHGHFWRMCQYWHDLGAHVYVSEGQHAKPPPQWVIVHEWIKRNGLTRQRESNSLQIERLYVHKDIRVIL